jgi:nicotinamidase-related amidase
MSTRRGREATVPAAAWRRASDTVITTGGETDVCVLATMLVDIDWGFRVILVTDACSSARTA